jgi:hypothetical protein
MILALSALVVPTIFAQVERGTVTGAVTDPTGAVVQGAKVTIRNIGTSIESRTESTAAGLYYLPSLPPGRYELRIEQTGFRPAVVSNIVLGANLTETFNVALQLGEVANAVEVQATAVQLESQTSGLGQVLQTRTIAELPVGRDPLAFAATVAGVQPVGGGAVNANGNPNTIVKMGGGTSTQNGVLTDGGENRGFKASTASIVPIESIAEFRLETATYSAEFGRSGGGVFNLVTKSGTNQFHGVGYEFLRNSALNANSWTNNRSGIAKTLNQQSQYGVAVGGPIRRNKLFFFYIYDAQRQHSPITALAQVPTPAQRNGDFTQTLDPKNNVQTIYDPATTRPDPANPGQYLRSPFLGNVIPSSRINPVSVNVLKYWPAPNRPGEGNSNLNNFFISSGKRNNNYDVHLARIDYAINENEKLFGRMNFAQVKAFSTGLPNEDVAIVSQNATSSPVENVLLGLTSVFSPNLLGEFRVGFIRLNSDSAWQGGGFDVASLGFPAEVNHVIKDLETNVFPNISVSQYTVGTGLSVTSGSSAEVSSLGAGARTFTPSGNWQVQYDVTLIRNKHKMRFGTQLELLLLNSYATNSPAGAYFFDRLYTQGPNPAVSTSNGGSGFASLLLGIPVSDRISIDPRLKINAKYYSGYFQDDYRVTPKLTANLGLRYEFTTPYSDKFGSIGYFDPNGTEPVTGLKGVFRFTKPGEYQTDPIKKNFGPRMGLAYTLTPKTVIRAAGSIFYAPADTLNPGTSDWGNGFFSLDEGSLGPPSPYPNTPSPGGSWSNPFATGILIGSRGQTFPGQNVRTFYKEKKLPLILQWNFNIQRLVTPTLKIQVGYIGSRVEHLAQNRFDNQVDPQYLSLGSKLADQVPNPFYGKITTGALSFPTVSRAQLLRPYPQYLQLLIPRVGYGDQHYSGFTAQVEKQLSHGLSFLVGYTFSKNITNNFESGVLETGPQNALYNPNFSRSLDTNDVPQRLVVSYLYELPIGKGRKFASRGLVGAVIGNWQLGGITVFQSGTPLRIAGPDRTGLPDFSLNVGRGNRICDPRLAHPTTNLYFNTACFVAAPPYTLPTDSITQPNLRDYGRANFDASLIRNQPFREHYNVQFRFDAYNALNHPILTLGTGSSVTIGTPQFGQVLSGGGQRNIQAAIRLVF